MSMIPDGVRRVFRLPASRDRLSRELDDEVAFHMEKRISELVRRGVPERDATAEALRRFGDADDLRDYCNQMEGARMRRTHAREWIESLVNDLQFSLRQARRAPAFVAIVVGTLALGIGGTTAIFSVVNAVLLRALPYPDPGRIVQIWEIGASGSQIQFADPNFADLRAQNRSFVAVAQARTQGTVSVAGTVEPVRANAALVSADFFRVFGVQPVAGRLFAPDELHPGGAMAVVISDGFRDRNFGRGRDVLGMAIRIGTRPFTIVGVMPMTLDYPAGTDLWFPREIEPSLPARTAHNWPVVARLAPGVSLERARGEASDIMKRLKRELGSETGTVDAAVIPLHEQLVGSTREILLLVMGAAAVLLLIACANVASLLIARMASRRGEVSLRLALGAGRQRLIQQFVVEALVLSLAGGVLGVAIARVGVPALIALAPAQLPFVGAVRVDWMVLLFALAVSLVVAVLLGLWTAASASGSNLREQLSLTQRTLSGAGATHRLRGALVVTQLALTVVLMAGAGLLGRSLSRLLSVDPGFRTDSAVVLDLAPTFATVAERAPFYDRLLERFRALPGVSAVAATNRFPMGGPALANGTFIVMQRIDEALSREDLPRLATEPGRTGHAEFHVASPGYFEAMRIPVVAGRAFESSDGPDRPHVAVISRSLATRQWPGESPLGKIIQFGNMDGDVAHPFTIVGIVEDVRDVNLATEPRPTFYSTYRQRPGRTAQLNIVLVGRGGSSTEAIAAAARSALRQLRPDVPPRFRTIEEILGRSVRDRRFVLTLVGVFGAVALVLASLGVYGVISYLVAQRSREISIRVALGAQRGDVTRLVVGQGVALAIAGVVLGLAASLALMRLIRGLLFGITPTDPVSLAAVAVIIAIAALAASYLPARRAQRLSPMDVLRSG